MCLHTIKSQIFTLEINPSSLAETAYLFSYLENFSVLAINSFWNDKENSNFFKRNTMVFYLLSSEKNSLTDMANGHRIQMLLPLTNFPINNIKCIIFLKGKIVFFIISDFSRCSFLTNKENNDFPISRDFFIYLFFFFFLNPQRCFGSEQF